MKITKQGRVGIVLFLAPAPSLILVFFIVPVPSVGVTNFFKWNGIIAPEFTGWQNYAKTFSDKVFWRSARNNLIWVVGVCLMQVSLALIVAVILSTKPYRWKILRTVYFLPQMISSIVIAILQSAVYNSEFGLLNGLFKLVGQGGSTRNRPGDPKTAFTCMLAYGLFYIGYFMVILMVGINDVDENYYETATIDGTNRLQMEWYIMIPLIRYSIMTCVMLVAVYALRTFEQLYLLTNGGPANRTSASVLYLYNQVHNNNYGGANASSMMLILTGTLVIIVVRRLFAKKER